MTVEIKSGTRTGFKASLGEEGIGNHEPHRLSVSFPHLEENPGALSCSGERLMTQFLLPDGGCHVALGSVAFGERKQNNFLKAVPSQVSRRVDG